MSKETKNILILGYGSTGKSLGVFLNDKKLNVYFWDDNQTKLEEIDAAFSIYTGQKLTLFECIFVSPGIKSKGSRLLNATAAAVTILVEPGPTEDVAIKICLRRIALA